MRRFLGRLPVRWRWTLHNMIGHPLSEVAYQFGLRDLSNAIHDQTIPDPHGEEPRG